MRPTLVFVAATFTIFAASTFTHAADGKLRVTWIDVEGGGATLIVTPAGESVLIDTGNPGERDAGRIAKAAREAGLTQLDHVIITHYHGDHYGGAAPLDKLIPIINLYDNGHHDERAQEAGAAFAEYRTFEVTKRQILKAGDKLSLKQIETNAAPPPPAMSITCLAARQEIIAPPPNVRLARNEHNLCVTPQRRAEDKSDNANSIVLLIRMGDFEFFDGGDLTWNIEEKLVCPFNLVGEVDVYQSNHHGLDASNNPLLIQSLRPTVAVFNNGHVKGCQPLAFLAVKGTPSIEAIYQVHKNLRKDVQNNTADDLIANHTPDKTCQAHSVYMTVDADAKGYVMSVPSRKHEQRFKTK